MRLRWANLPVGRTRQVNGIRRELGIRPHNSLICPLFFVQPIQRPSEDPTMKTLRKFPSWLPRKLEGLVFALFALVWTASLGGCQTTESSDRIVPKYGGPDIQDTVQAKYGIQQPVDSTIAKYGAPVPKDTTAAKYGIPVPKDSVVALYGIKQPDPIMVRYGIPMPVDTVIAKYGVPRNTDSTKTSYTPTESDEASA